jgi:hypothetical protein
MIRRTIRDMMIETLIRSNGMKDSALAMEVMRRIMPAVFGSDMYREVLSALILDGEIIDLKFTSPESPNPSRIQSIFFIRGTTLIVSPSERTIANAETSPLDRESKSDV